VAYGREQEREALQMNAKTFPYPLSDSVWCRQSVQMPIVSISALSLATKYNVCTMRLLKGCSITITAFP